MEEFKLGENEFVELSGLLKFMGLCDSGGMAKTEVSQGHVRVDGNVELRKRCKIRAGQIVEFAGRKIVVK